MEKTLGVITVHGMGETKDQYDKEGHENPDWYALPLLKGMQKALTFDEYAHVAWGHVFYQDILHDNQERFYTAIEMQVGWHDLRRFMIHGFCDAASLESQKTGTASPYFRAQDKILEVFRKVYAELEPGSPLFIVAHSLGGQVVSNYLWDGGKTSKRPKNGVWSKPPLFDSDEEEEFCRGYSMTRLITTGCNIPLFVAGRHVDDIYPIDPRQEDKFEWLNYYDSADVLGYPLQPLSPRYGKLVTDCRIRAGSWGGILPTSHTQYWQDSEFRNELAAEIRNAI